ncbi:DUF5684 domain-containing protein, partial [Cryobacterium sp. TMT1-3]|uniref:DUF5684 domain-containing protein n=1 Tax=Cryobacterium sp. TMT1-3 TaxID=1259237 RepID=UPI001F547A03
MDESSGAVIAAIVVTVLVSLGVYVFSAIALGRIFVKLGEQAWKGWVPIVNTITLFELGRYSALWVIGLFIPAANLVALVVFIMAVNNVNRRLGHGGGFTLLYLVSFPIWAGVVGFGKSVDTGWMPGVAATGYVPFAPVTPLSMTPLSMRAAAVAAAPAEPRLMPPAPPAPPAAFLAAAPPAPPAPPVPSTPPAPPVPSTPPAPPVVSGLPTGPPPFYVSAPPAPPIAAQPAFSAPPAPPAPPVFA